MRRERGHPLPSAYREGRLATCQLGASLFRGHAVSQAADDCHEATDVVVGVDRQRKIHVNWHACEEAARQWESCREHPDDRMRHVFNRERLTDDVVVPGESPLPIAVGQHHCLRDARSILVLLKKPASRRRGAEHGKKLLGDAKPCHAFRGSGTRYRENIRGTSGPRADLLEGGEML